MNDEALRMAIEALQNINRLPTIGQRGLRDYESDALVACKEALGQPTGNSSKLPVAWQWLTSGHMRQKIPKTATPEHWRPLYTHPKQWQGLTNDEIEALALDNDVISVISQVEQALKEKNHE